MTDNSTNLSKKEKTNYSKSRLQNYKKMYLHVGKSGGIAQWNSCALEAHPRYSKNLDDFAAI
jgi:hypothetical protein